LQYPEIESHSQKVIKTLTAIETAILTTDDRWFTVRIMPYRTMDDRIDGLVITFTDITRAKKLEIELKEAITILKENNLQNKVTNAFQ
jgi:two-component system CheB/CheR fusion protein